jgi:hypothetical protein
MACLNIVDFCIATPTVEIVSLVATSLLEKSDFTVFDRLIRLEKSYSTVFD